MADLLEQIQSYELGGTNVPSNSRFARTSSPKPGPPLPLKLNLSHSNFNTESSRNTSNPPSTPGLLSSAQFATAMRSPSIKVETPIEYNTIFGQSQSPPESRYSRSNSMIGQQATPDGAEPANTDEICPPSADTLTRSPSAPSRISNSTNAESPLYRTSSVFSYQNSVLTPCTTTQSVPELSEVKVSVNNSDWASYYKLSDEFTLTLGSRTVTLQNDFHNFIVLEENFVTSLKVFLELFEQGLLSTLDSERQKFKQEVFDPLHPILDLNEIELLLPLKEDQEKNGPFLTFNYSVVKTWIDKIKGPILDYARRYPYASQMCKEQLAKNARFKAFVNATSTQSRKLVLKDFSGLFESTRTRFGQYNLALKDIAKHIRKQNENDESLPKIEECIEELKQIMRTYDNIQGEVGSRLEITNLEKKLLFKDPDFKEGIFFGDEERKILFSGDAKLKKSEIDPLENIKLFLLDHFLFLTHPKGNGYLEVYTKPIHLEFLVIESVSEDPLFKSNAMAVVSKLTRNKSEASSQPRSASTTAIPAGSPILENGSSTATRATSVGDASRTFNQNAHLVYPIKLRNIATDQKYYVCTEKEITRKEWVKRICDAKMKYSIRARELKFDPLSIHVLDRTTFSTYEPQKPYLLTKGNPLSRALEEHKKLVGSQGFSSSLFPSSARNSSTLSPIKSASSATRRPSSVTSSSGLNCSTEVDYNNMRMMFVGLNDGFYGCQLSSTGIPLNWVLIARVPSVFRMEAVEEKNMLFVLSNKTLYMYKFNEVVLCILTHGSIQSKTEVKVSPPVTINQSVDCFKAGMLSGRPFLFYSVYTSKSTITVLEITTENHKKKSSSIFSFSSKSHDKNFKELDILFTPTRNHAITFFNSNFCIHTDNSFEVMRLDIKRPFTIPVMESVHQVGVDQNLPEDDISELKKKIQEGRPISINKIPAHRMYTGENKTSSDFLLCYHKFGILCDEVGDLKSAKCINHHHKITAAHVWYPYLITFSDRLIEIRMLTGGADVHMLVQVVTGRNIRMLGQNGENRLVFTMADPERPQGQLVLEFLLNDEVTDNQSTNTLTYL